ncbi:hypothetical protein EV182_007255 [Spiromyces aspiralis]|uniref:Uncharacterized protein n=1 Tax=Spiromyces aspiralis TaxID=68401 RepID=A0ACC1H8Z6_9FUNG|nr:hypothetical protein EV182_007255 [Spiromyces aspiralis]
MIPSASKGTASRVLNAPIDKVWDAVCELDFSFWRLVQKSETLGDGDKVGNVHRVVFKDGTVQKYKVVEYSELEHAVTYELIESNPPTRATSALYTIQVRPVTSNNTSFVEWTSEFSMDGGVEVVQDSKYKKQEALEDLAKLVEG